MIILTQEYKSHIAEIDEQHQELVDQMNSFEGINMDSHTSESIEDELNFLAEYIGKHFKYEEGLMVESGYPDYEWHKNWHKGYVLKFGTLLEEYFENGITEKFAYILSEFVLKWFDSHIKNVDVNLGRFILESRKKNEKKSRRL